MRILTRGDMDGLTSAVLLTEVEDIKEIWFAHPKDVQDGKVSVTTEDIVVNLPYVPGCGLWFDHHISEAVRLEDHGNLFKGRFEVAPSCARVVYNHYRHPAFEQYKHLLDMTDKVDSAQLTMDEVQSPEGWILLAYTLDPRSGLGPEFQKYFRWLVEYVKEVQVEKVLQHPEVKRRADRVLQEQAEFEQVLRECCTVDGNVIVTDFRGKQVPAGNRFLVFAMYPACNVEVRIIMGKGGANTVAAVGASIFNRTLNVNIGELLGSMGGGGHKGAGTVQLPTESAEARIKDLVAILKENKA